MWKGRSVMDITFCFHPRYNEFDKCLLEIIPEYESLKTYYQEFDEKMRMPDLYGKALRVSSKQLPQIYKTLQEICSDLSIAIPDVFVYENVYYEIESYGTTKPWVELSTKIVSDFSADELKFVLARELFKIKYSINERYAVAEQILKIAQGSLSGIALTSSISDMFHVKYAQWSRIAQYSADNYGYLQTRNLSACISAVLKFIFNNEYLVKNINVREYLADISIINELNDTVSIFTKNDEKVPYGQFRIKNLIAFASSELAIKQIIKRSC